MVFVQQVTFLFTFMTPFLTTLCSEKFRKLMRKLEVWNHFTRSEVIAFEGINYIDSIVLSKEVNIQT